MISTPPVSPEIGSAQTVSDLPLCDPFIATGSGPWPLQLDDLSFERARICLACLAVASPKRVRPESTERPHAYESRLFLSGSDIVALHSLVDDFDGHIDVVEDLSMPLPANTMLRRVPTSFPALSWV